MTFPGRPHRLPGYDYSSVGPVFHCRLAVAHRAPALADPRVAQALVDALVQYDKTVLRVFASCVMPDHLHILIALRSSERSLSRIVGDLKRWVTRRVSGQSETFAWQRGFFERVMRSDEDLVAAARYIVANPVRAGLVENPSDYPWVGSLEWNLWGGSEG